jgi:hypothetical protein
MLTFVVPTGDVKIFDFGLSKEFDPAKKTESGMYHFTECTGSPRYSKFHRALPIDTCLGLN